MLTRLSSWTALFLLVAYTAVLAADDPKEKLKERQLTLMGVQFVLEDEKSLNQEIAKVNQARATWEKARRDYRSSERKINRAKAYITSLQYKLDKMKDNSGKVMSKTEYNQLVERVNSLSREIGELTEEKRKREEAAQSAVDDAKAAYTAAALQSSDMVKKISEKYKKLAEDKQVAGWIEQASKADKRPYTLGPSPVFESRLRFLTKLRGEIDAGEVSVRREGNILWVDVKLNGKASRSMVLDSGASAICLPFDVAMELGIEPTDADPIIQVKQADGKVVDARLKRLESVQVGQFIQHNVECLVLPQELIAAHPLLGGTFLNHYIYRVDPDRQMLLLTQSEKKVRSLMEVMTNRRPPQPDQPQPDQPQPDQPQPDQPQPKE